jgi:TRAP-type mannitol/chloroaromatic compound transport system permease small subunit
MATLERTLQRLDAISVWTARVSGWLILPLTFVLVYEVVSRKFFHRPTMWASDLSYMLYGTLFMLGAAYALQRGAHIRTDFLYRRWPVRAQGTVDAILYLLFFFPGIALFLWVGGEFAWTSWLQGERAITSSWRAPIYLLKMVIPLAAVLLLLQGVAEFLKSLHAALHGRWR